MASTTNNDSQSKLNTALGTLKAGGSVPISKTSAARQVNGQIYIYNPQVIQPFQFVGNKQKVAAAVRAGKISPITTAQLSAALNPTKPKVPKPKATPATTKKLKGTADDDKGKKKKPGPKTRKEADPDLSPGKRLKNPLGALSSYNYQLSLYMVTPDALDIFIDNGTKDINKLGVNSVNGPQVSNSAVTAGAYIVAQSGGVDLVKEQRAPSFGFDYGIDNLTFEILGPNENGSATAQTNFRFTITEPLGFSFISNLKRAADAIKDYTNKVRKKQSALAKKKAAATNNRKDKNKKNSNTNNSSQGGAISGKSPSGTAPASPQNPTKNFFILGIRFYGYNASGQLVRGTDTTAANNGMGGVSGEQQIDPGNSGYALFERFYPISINTMKTRVDGRATVYTVEAQSYSLSALGTKRGIINNDTKLTASTVGKALDELMAKLNAEQKKLNNNSQDGYVYDIKYASPYDADRIRSSKIVSPADLDKYKWPGSGAKTTKESNTGTETSKGNKPKNNAREITINRGTPIVQAINQIIAQSSFLEDALRTVFTTALEPDQDKEDLPALDNSGKKTIEWYHCVPDIKAPVWNEETADWVYDIDYVLNIYDTPVLDTAYTNPSKKYYGPVKRYEYWYTGKNTEVLSYQQTLDNSYYTTFLGDSFGVDKKKKDANKKGGTNTEDSSNGSGNASGVTSSKVQNQKNSQPRQGKQGNAMEAQNSYMTTLFDPTNNAKAVVEILGDPDWMMSTAPSRGGNESTVYSKFYGKDGFAINPTAGQVFFEIDFKEAIDYKSDGQNVFNKNGLVATGAPGTLSINNSILFWKDPKSLSKLTKGISYSLNKCVCTFSNGVFKQRIEGFINTFGDSGSNDDGKAREKAKSNRTSNSGPNKGSGNATTSNKGLKAKGGRTSGRGKPSAAEQSRIDKANAQSLAKQGFGRPPTGPLAGGYTFGGET
jgi:hypothetical protein